MEHVPAIQLFLADEIDAPKAVDKRLVVKRCVYGEHVLNLIQVGASQASVVQRHCDPATEERYPEVVGTVADKELGCAEITEIGACVVAAGHRHRHVHLVRRLEGEVGDDAEVHAVRDDAHLETALEGCDLLLEAVG